MSNRFQVKIIKGPIVPIVSRWEWEHPVLYSVHLENGWIATSPNSYPDSAVEGTGNAPAQPRTFDEIAQVSIEKNREVLRQLAKY